MTEYDDVFRLAVPAEPFVRGGLAASPDLPGSATAGRVAGLTAAGHELVEPGAGLLLALRAQQRRPAEQQPGGPSAWRDQLVEVELSSCSAISPSGTGTSPGRR